MGTSKKAKKKSKDNPKKQRKRGSSDRAEQHSAAGDREIAKALRQVEDARDELTKREQKLSALFAKHGRGESPEKPVADVEAVDVSEPVAEAAAPSVDGTPATTDGEAGAEDATELLQRAFEGRE